MKVKQIAGMAVAAAALICVGLVNVGIQQAIRADELDRASKGVLSGGGDYGDGDYGEYGEEAGGFGEITFPEENFVQRIDVMGEITRELSYDYAYSAYDHQWTMDLIDQLMENDYNQGILLFIDSPGGAIYESDELYLKLLDYKEETGRPVRAYLASEACSGGYYVAMAADRLSANRNGLVGSIGVIATIEDYSKMLDDMGISEINFVSGENKAMSSGTSSLTEEQIEIYQAMVDESYEQFVDVVAEGRGMTREQVKALADGRFYTARQALENGLVDEIAGYEDVEDAFLEELGVTVLN